MNRIDRQLLRPLIGSPPYYRDPASIPDPASLDIVLSHDVFNRIPSTGPARVTHYLGLQYSNGTFNLTAPVRKNKGLYVGPEYTNLFQTNPNAPETVTLATDTYCLTCEDGSVTCSAGVATPGNPLKIAATAGDMVFTPASCTKWMLTRSNYAFAWIPPGGTQNDASGSTSLDRGCWFVMDTDTQAAFSGAFSACLDVLIVAGSAEMPATSGRQKLFTVDDGSTLYYETQSGTGRIVRSVGGGSNQVITSAWSGNTIRRCVLQTNAADTQFRIGYREYDTAGTPLAAWQWDPFVTYDGSFDPGPVLRVSIQNTVPLFFQRLVVWDVGDVTEAQFESPFG